mmetsp:Transcript_12888/g.42152  ORF Transcript_12888/g.42152 Transcript_12888/m.42152 type:complete len:263 (+) Transcript_12888:369-1157(+)
MALHKVHQRLDAVASGAALLVVPHRAGNVHVRPRSLLDKLLEEESRRDRSALRSIAEVLEVRDGRLDLLGILGRERHAPERLAGGLCATEQLVAQLVVVRPQAGVRRAQRDDARSSERRHIHDSVHLAARLCLCVDERVGQRQPPLGVGVDHLDRLAVARSQNVTGTHRRLRNHVLARRHDEVHLNPSWRSVGEHARCPEHRSCAPHVELHLFNHRAGAGLDVVSPRVKGETLADEAHALAHLSARWREGHVDELWRLHRTL